MRCGCKGCFCNKASGGAGEVISSARVERKMRWFS